MAELVAPTREMPETLPRYTPRQIADAIVCAVLDAYAEQTEDAELQDERNALELSDAVLGVLRDMKVAFVDNPSGDYWGVS